MKYMTRAQKRVWITQLKNPTSPLFNIGFYSYISGVLDYVSLKKSIEHFVTTNTIFRMNLI